MKTIFVSVLALFVSFQVLANDNNNTNTTNSNNVKTLKTAAYVSQDGNFVKLGIEKPDNVRLKIQIIDYLNRTVTDAYVGKDQPLAVLKLDVSELPSGTYTLKFTYGNEVKTKTLAIRPRIEERTVSVSALQ